MTLLHGDSPVGDRASSLVALLQARAGACGPDDGYTFLLDGEKDEAKLSFADLDRRARAIAAHLQSLGARGERALLLYPPGLEYIAAFFGCLYAEVIAVPAYPPDPARLPQTLPRIQAIARDAGAKLVLTTGQVRSLAGMLRHTAPDLAALDWQATDGLPDGGAEGWQPCTVDGNSIAFLQYTSGSTGDPKGVVVTHGNLLHNSAAISDCFETSAQHRGVIWLPPYHDMGLIGGILQPLYAGFSSVLMSPMAFLRRPVRWLRAISRHRGTVSGGPNFAYDLCTRRVGEADRETLDLSSWRVAFNGAEPVRSETLERFTEAFGPCGFRREAFLPCYGLAEATLLVTGTPAPTPPTTRCVSASELQRDRVIARDHNADDGRALVSSGVAWSDHEIAIVDPERRTRCRPGHIGEIWVAGRSVVGGYWQRPEQTKETFAAFTAVGEGPFLRTGDLGFLRDGELYVTGRIKDLIVVRGKNHYPHDIELTAETSHLAVRPGRVAAFAIDRSGKERLVLTCEVRQSPNLRLGEVSERIAQSVAAHHGLHVDSVTIVDAGELPKTSSGKLQRRATRRRFLTGDFKVLHETPAALPVGASNTARAARTTLARSS